MGIPMPKARRLIRGPGGRGVSVPDRMAGGGAGRAAAALPEYQFGRQ